MERFSRDHNVENNSAQEPNFFGASIITATGEEVPITEKMLQNSFSALIDAWEKSQKKN